MKRITLAISCLALAAAVVGVISFGRTAGPRPMTAEAPEQTAAGLDPKRGASGSTGSSGSAAGAAGASALRDGWAVGAVHRYRLEARQTVTLGGQAPLAVVLQGTWETRVVRRSAGSVEVEARLHEPRLSVGEGQAMPDDVVASLAQPYGFVVDPAGRAVELRFPADMPPSSRALLRAPVALAQVQRRDGAEWTVEEDDATGTCLVAYAEGAGGELIKSCTRYLSVATDGGVISASALGDLTPSGLTRVTVGQDGRPRRVVARTGVAGQAGGLRFEAQLDATLELVAARQEPVRQAAVGLIPAPMAAAEALPAHDEARPVDVVLTELEGVTEAGERRAALQVELEKGLRGGPAAVGEAVAAVRRVTHRQAGPILAAMAAAGTEAAQGGLIELAGDLELAGETRSDALSMMALVGRPTGASITALAELADGDGEVATTATLALGAAAGKGEGPEADDAVAALLGRLATAQTTEEAVLALVALGNTGDPRIVPAVRATLESPVEDLRAFAVRALRFVPTPEADQIIAATLLGDPAGAVRLGAVEATARRPLASHVTPLHRALHTDQEPAVRMAAVQLVGAHLQEVPALTTALVWNAESDPDPQIRQVASAILGYE